MINVPWVPYWEDGVFHRVKHVVKWGFEWINV